MRVLYNKDWDGLCIVWSHGVFVIIFKPAQPERNPRHTLGRTINSLLYTIKNNDVEEFWNIILYIFYV